MANIINDFITNCGTADSQFEVKTNGVVTYTYGCSRGLDDLGHTHSSDLATSRMYTVYRENGPFQGGDDEALYYEFNVLDKDGNKLESVAKVITEVPVLNEEGEPVISEETGEAETEEKKVTVGNKSSYPYNSIVKIEVVPNAILKAEHKYARVEIDGKDYNLSILDKPVEFDMNQLREHRIRIRWSKDLIESFRVVALR